MNAPHTLALVDDFTRGRESMRRYLAPEGFRITHYAENGQEFLSQLTHTVTLPQFCLLDVLMPVMNGMETARRLKADYPSIRILAIYHCFCRRSEMLAAGADAFVLRGSGPEQMRDALLALQ